MTSTPILTSSISDAQKINNSKNNSKNLTNAPFKIAIVYNQSAHAVKMVVDELRSEWGNNIKIIQVIGDNQAMASVDDVIKIDPQKWNDLNHFESQLNPV